MAKNTKVSNPYADPEMALAEAAVETTAAEVEAQGSEQTSETATESEFPVVYYNPKVPNEQFYIPGTPYRKRFVNGRFFAQNPSEEAAVRACLIAWGPDKPDRWKGDDMKREWVDRRTGFRTRNEQARWDFEYYHNDVDYTPDPTF